MKNPLNLSIFLFCITVISLACSKNGNNYSSADHTVGLTKVWSWSGTSSGYLNGDTVRFPPPDTTHVDWAYAFHHNMSDTSFPVTKVNGFAVSILGTQLNYARTDSALQTVTFDTTISGAVQTILIYYYAKDSISYKYHIVSGFNTIQNRYYQVNDSLHTNSH